VRSLISIPRKGEMKNKITSPYDVAEHLRTPQEMVLYLQACIEESNGSVKFIASAVSDIAKAQDINLKTNGPRCTGI
jgi:DNA-binding phage protein